MVRFRRLRERLGRRSAASTSSATLTAEPPALPKLKLGIRGKTLIARWWLARKISGMSDKGLWRLVSGISVFLGILVLGFFGLVMVLILRGLDAIAGR